jgi:glycosyltransferase involved in cell wall biosynthesis
MFHDNERSGEYVQSNDEEQKMKVAYFILNSFEYDTRARLEVETLSKLGYEIDVIVTVGADADNFLGHPLHRIKQNKWPSRKVRFLQYNLAAEIGIDVKADIYHAVDVDVLTAAYRAAKKTGGKLIYEARELYTELEPLKGRRVVKAIWEAVERRYISTADYVFTINNSIADELVKRYGVKRPDVIRNVAKLPEKLSPVNLHEKYNIPADQKILIYQGVLRSGQGLMYALDVMKHLDNTMLIMLGAGHLVDELNKKIADLGLENKVILPGRVPPEELLNYTAGADAGLLFMEDTALNNKLALPQKIFQYLVAGISQIVSPMPEIAGFVEAENTGIVVSLDDPVKASKSINTFLSDNLKLKQIKTNCEKSSKINNWDVESKKLVEIYRRFE